MITICPAGTEHEHGWRALWAMYCAGAVSDETTNATWSRILDPRSPIGGVVALTDDGLVVGFVVFVVHECTWEIRPVCYVEDMIVRKQFRGPTYNVGQLMGEHMYGRLVAGEWSRMYGVTHADNILAQRLYGGFVRGEPYVRYVARGFAISQTDVP